ncbi:MAG: site-specific integrase [Balneolaceae bacterium]
MPATFHFLLREDRPNKQGLCPIYFLIIHNRKKKYMNTGVRIDPKYWNPDKRKVRRGHRTCNKLNQELEIIRENAASAYRELNREKRASADAIKKRLEYVSKDNFFTLADEYLTTLNNYGQFWTWKQTKVAIQKIRDYHKSDHLPVNLIDADFLTKFQGQLRQRNKPSTILKNFGNIKKVLNLAVRKHLIPANPMNSDDFKLINNNGADSKTKLTLDQIRKIENLKLDTGSNIWHSRNAFILSFYFCGMRFGDVAEVKWSNVKNGRLEYDMNKTGNPVNLPIKDGARKILNAYEGANNNGYVFPFLADLSEEQQKDPITIRKRISVWNAIVNGQDSDGKTTGLKAIAKLARIDEGISMHVARHSFAQYGVNDKNIPPYKMMMLLGHKNIKTTMQYLKSLDLKTVDTVMDEIF